MFGVPEAWEELLCYSKKAALYREKYMNASFSSWNDVPYTVKSELRSSYPDKHFALEWNAIGELHTSSGSTGKAVLVGYSEKDALRWHQRLALALERMGVNQNDRIQITFGYGLFTGGMGWHGGARALKSCVLPASTGNSEQQLYWMQTLGTTVLNATPLYALHLAQIAAHKQLSLPKLRCIVTGAEPLTKAIKSHIQAIWDVPIYDTYGLSEAHGPGVANECMYKTGLHIHSDFFPELYDPTMYGEELVGELVLTSLHAEAMPLIRYRTGDRVRLRRHQCHCGFVGWSITEFLGRSDDMISYKGVNVYPADIEACIQTEEKLQPIFTLRLRHNGMEATLDIYAKTFLSVQEQKELIQRIDHKIKKTVGIHVPIKICDAKILQSDGKKHKRVIYE